METSSPSAYDQFLSRLAEGREFVPYQPLKEAYDQETERLYAAHPRFSIPPLLSDEEQKEYERLQREHNKREDEAWREHTKKDLRERAYKSYKPPRAPRGYNKLRDKELQLRKEYMDTEEYKARVEEYQRAMAEHSDRAPLRPGALIRLRSGTLLLVGDVNALLGVCDDCVYCAESEVEAVAFLY